MDHPKIRTGPTGDLYLNFGAYGQEVEVACFSGDGRRVLTVQDVGVARLWDVESGRQVGEVRPTSPLAGSDAGPTTRPFEVFIEAAALDQAGAVALLGLNDGTAGLFTVSDGSRRTIFHHPERPPAKEWDLIRAVNLSPDGSLAVVGFFGRCVGVWATGDGRPVAFLRSDQAMRLHTPSGWGRDTLVSSVAVSADNRFVFAGHSDMTATLWDLATGALVQDAYEHQEEILALWHGAGALRWATSGGIVWEAAGSAGKATRCLESGDGWLEAAIAPDGNWLLTRTRDGRVMRYVLSGAAECLAQRSPGPWWFNSSSDERTVGFVPGGRGWVYPVAADALALATETETRNLPIAIRNLRATFSPDGSMLATRGHNRLRIWSVPAGEMMADLGCPDTFWAAGFSWDGSRLAAGTLGQVTADNLGPKRIISLRDVVGRKRLYRWPAHDHQIHQVAFTPDGRHLVSASLDRTVRLWRLPEADGELPALVGRLRYEDLEFDNLAVLSDGRIIVFRRSQVDIWTVRGKVAELPAGLAYRARWLVSADEKLLILSRGSQTVEAWELSAGRLQWSRGADIVRPDVVPGPGVVRGRAMARGYLWRTPGGNFVHVGDGPRGWAIPLRHSPDGKHVVVPCADSAALVALDPEPRVLLEFPFEGTLRASCVTADCVLAVNSAGRVFLAPRAS